VSYSASSEQVSSVVRLFERLGERHAKLLALIPKNANQPRKCAEKKDYRYSERSRMLQRSPEARAKRDVEIIAAYKSCGVIEEAARIANTSSTTASRVLSEAGLTTKRQKAQQKRKGSELYNTIVSQISAKKTK
jgi:hypothetical protein